jgi:hypothetical protein
MRASQHPFVGIENAIAKLGYPKTIWYRGHCAEHRLLPALYRFPDGVENEIEIIERYSWNIAPSGIKTPAHGITTLIALHHSYVPTRLLEWTGRLRVALFCALIRESDRPAVFVLDPFALNTCSKVAGIVKLDSYSRTTHSQTSCEFLRWPNESSLPEHPVAIVGRSTGCEMAETEAMFTLHGTNDLFLEEQCPDCVRKVVLTEEEKSLAKESVLFDSLQVAASVAQGGS